TAVNAPAITRATTTAAVSVTMTQIHFTFNAPDSLLTACHIAARRYLAGDRLDVYSSQEARLQAFDQLLWEYEAEAFIPHVLAGHRLAAQTPIVLHHDPQSLKSEWVLNLDEVCLPHADRHSHVIEVVSAVEHERL